MIITKKKNFTEILSKLNKNDNVFIVGCGSCATKCNTGSLKAVEETAEQLKNNNVTVSGFCILDTACDIRIARKDLSKNKNFNNSDIVLCLTCGAGVQSVEKITDKKIVAGLDGIFVGTTERIGVYNNFCSTCGECIIDKTAGICVVTRCSKGLINGPCGGAINGKCEVNREQDCAWVLVYNKLKAAGNLDYLKSLYTPPRTIIKPKKINESLKVEKVY